MVLEFPVARAQLPRINVMPHEREARKLQMDRVLQLALDEYDRFRTVEQSRLDVAKWKLADSQDMLRLFRERDANESVGNALSSTASSFSASDDSSNSQSSHDRWEDEISSLSADGHDRHKALRMVGDLTGRVENAVYAFITRIMREFALVQTFLHDDVVDCAILSELEGPTKETPLHALGYKWVVKKVAGKTDKYRDIVYLEACGVTTTGAGEKIGYVLLESVDLPSFPKLKDHNCQRTALSVRILLRQKTDELIDVFATGVAEPSSSKKSTRAMTAQVAAQTMFTLTKAMDLAECMRLTKLLARQRPARDQLIKSRKHKPSACTLCHTKRKFYNDVTLMDCIVCGHAVCPRCYTVKRVFIADGILGRFYRVDCCDTCLLAVDRTGLAVSHTPMKNNVSSQLQRLNSSRNFESMENYSFSRPRSSSDSSVSPTDIAGKHGFGTTVEEEETMPAEPSRSKSRGRPADVPSTNHQRGGTAEFTTRHHQQWRETAPLPAPQDRRLAQAANPPVRRNVPSTTSVAAVRLPEQQQSIQRHPNGSSATAGRYQLSRHNEPLPARPAPPAVFTSSSTAITYDLRGHTRTAPTLPQAVRPAAPQTGAGSSQQDLLARMMELQRVAESTYQTTKQNERFMQQQQRTPGSRFEI